jgi:hypothetical protein
MVQKQKCSAIRGDPCYKTFKTVCPISKSVSLWEANYYKTDHRGASLSICNIGESLNISVINETVLVQKEKSSTLRGDPCYKTF